MKRRKTEDIVRFVEGPSINPVELLLDWIEHQQGLNVSPRKLIRVPVVIIFENERRIAIKDVFIGISDGIVRENNIMLSVDDARMGISLLSRLRHICPQAGTTCAVWLEGYWGATLSAVAPSEARSAQEQDAITRYHFSVLKVVGPVHELPENIDDVHILIEDRSAQSQS